MRTPCFDDLCAEIRGFDLADDGPLRARLEARIAAEPGAIEHEAWSLLAVLRLRAGELAGTLDALTRAEAAGASASIVAFLRAHVLATLGRYGEAGAALERAARDDDEGLSAADLLHARGALAWAQGELPRALEHFKAALDDDPHDPLRWLDTGRALAEANRFEEAERAFDHALAEDEQLDDARFERASLWLACDRVAEATGALAELAERDPSLRERAHNDPRWRRARTNATVAALLSPTPRPPTWLTEAPPWLGALARDPALADVPIEWIDAETSASIMARIAAAHDRAPPGTMHTAATLAFARERLQGMVAIARGPLLHARDRVSTPMLWLLDRARDRVVLAPSEGYPAFLWLPAGRDVAGLRAALATLVPQPFPTRLELTGSARGFIGYRLQFGVPSPYTGELEPANAAELDRHFALNPFVEPGAWGSAYVDDPWPAELPAQPRLQLGLTAREQVVTRQSPGRVWSISRRTRHSRSVLSIELHHRDIFVAEVRYRPSAHAAVIGELNARFGSDYPVDLPIDVIGALLGFRFDSSADLEAQLAGTNDPEQIAGLLLVISALRHGDISVTTLYRRWLEHADPGVRSTLYNVFVAHNHESLLEESCVTEPDAEMRAQIEAVLDDGIGVVQWDPYRDYELDGDATAEAP